mgnify:CR=1 FL=1
MISNEMFGSDIIRVKINGYLKNNTENELITFNEKGIKNKEKIREALDEDRFGAFRSEYSEKLAQRI